ncbi:MAG: hypothetical protein KJP07_23295 [Desulfatitalea sp.]|nr:hypothetical protein [Desulfatitalea sp.]
MRALPVTSEYSKRDCQFMKTKHADDPKKLAGEIHGDDIVELMEKISDIKEVKDFNTLVFLNKPFQSNVIAGMLFAEIHCVDVSTGIPQFDHGTFNQLSEKDKLIDAEGLIDSVAGLILSIEKVREGLMQFMRQLTETTKELKSKNQL